MAPAARAASERSRMSQFNFGFGNTNDDMTRGVSRRESIMAAGYPHGPPAEEPSEELPPPYSRFEESPHLPPAPEAVRWAPGRGVFPHRYQSDLEAGVRRMNTVTLDDLRDEAAEQEARRRHAARQRRWNWGAGARTRMTVEKRRKLEKARHWCFIVVLVVAVLVVSIVGGVVGSRSWRKPASSSSSTIAEQADGADDGPSLPLGTVVVRPFRGAERLSACVGRSYQWSCILPADTRVPTTTASNDDVRVPEFRFEIKRREAGADADADADPESEWIPIPRSVPNTTDYRSVASVDGVADAGEESEFYITLITKAASSTSSASAERELVREESHMLPSAVANQPLRLFDRGLGTEHYGFHVYFEKTIQFANSSKLTETRDVGGVAAADSRYRIQWNNTRFKVSIFTRQSTEKTVDTVGDPETALPVDVWEDRVGGDRQGRTVTAWELDTEGAPQRKVGIAEVRGIRTEERGCYCHWTNYRSSQGGPGGATIPR